MHSQTCLSLHDDPRSHQPNLTKSPQIGASSAVRTWAYRQSSPARHEPVDWKCTHWGALEAEGEWERGQVEELRGQEERR